VLFYLRWPFESGTPNSGHLLQLLILVFSGWLQRQQAEVIEYLKTENRMLRQKLGGRRILFTDAERRLLARRAYAIFIERRRPGRPCTRAEIEALVVRMATDNPGWGYTRLMGAMRNLGYKVGRGAFGASSKTTGSSLPLLGASRCPCRCS
jgi:putative transposase